MLVVSSNQKIRIQATGLDMAFLEPEMRVRSGNGVGVVLGELRHANPGLCPQFLGFDMLKPASNEEQKSLTKLTNKYSGPVAQLVTNLSLNMCTQS